MCPLSCRLLPAPAGPHALATQVSRRSAEVPVRRIPAGLERRPEHAPAPPRAPAERPTRTRLPLHGPHRLRRIDPAEVNRDADPACTWRPQRAFLSGATSDPGIGREVLYGLLKAGLEVVTVARSPERAATLRAAAEARFGPQVPLDIKICDVQHMAEVHQMCDAVARERQAFDLIIHCVGAMFARFERTREQRERSLAINGIAPWLMSLRLTDADLLAPNGRVVHASSGLHRSVGGMLGMPGPRRVDVAELEDPQRFETQRDYGRSKLVGLALDFGLQARLSARGVQARVFSFDPGMTLTQLGRDFSARDWLTRNLAEHVFPLFAGTAAEGAAPALSLALDPDLVHAGGGYYTRFRRVAPAPAVRHGPSVTAVWEWANSLADAARPDA